MAYLRGAHEDGQEERLCHRLCHPRVAKPQSDWHHSPILSRDAQVGSTVQPGDQ